jgi:hypothetical protein
MTRAGPVCSNCGSAVPTALINTGQLESCPSCASQIETEIFPAFFRPIAPGSVGDALVVDTHASCYYHPQKQAAVLCVTCGRFICSLCDVELEGQHLCPPCLETAHKTGKIKSIESRRVLHDTIALNLAFLSFLIFYISFITAPLALYIALKHRKEPSSLLGRSGFRRWAAIVISSLQILAWITVILVLVFRR